VGTAGRTTDRATYPGRVPKRHLRLTDADNAEIEAALGELRRQLRVPTGFPEEVVAEAERAARSPRRPRADETDVPFVTIDPPTSKDLDQALHLERDGKGYHVRYAIADVAAFVKAGGKLDDEAHRRGETLYAPDGNARLYPPVLSEGAASLLPDEVRPALVWTLQLDGTGEGIDVHVRRALVRSRAKLDYAGVQRSLDDGSADDVLFLLREVGILRQQREARRGGVSLQLPEQEVTRGRDGYELSYRPPLPVEGWNAQISLMTGMAAAELMLTAKVGILRTVPSADPERLARLRRTAAALDVPWPAELDYADFVRSLDANVPRQAALLQQAAGVMRGSGYTAFEGRAPKDPVHAALASTYAHTTAPLRRLVDRYVGEACVALSAGKEPAAWVRDALPELPAVMQESAQKASQYEAGIVSTLEAAVLQRRVGKTFEAVVVEIDDDGEGGVVQLREPAVTARCEGKHLPLGARIEVRLELADVMQRQVRFAVAEPSTTRRRRASSR
jgi:exoribonuclease R